MKFVSTVKMARLSIYLGPLLQKVYTKTLGGRDSDIFETVHIGVGLPMVLPLLPIDILNTDGVRAVKTG